MRALIVDDNRTNVLLLRKLVERVGGCDPTTFLDPLEALRALGTSQFDLVMVDYMMPELDGLAFIRRLRDLPGYAEVPVVMITTSDERQVRYDALEAGATDFLTKPLDGAELKPRLKNLLKLRQAQIDLGDRAAWLAREVEKATEALFAREDEIVLRLSRAVEHRDAETGGHILRVAKYARLIAEALGCDPAYCRNMCRAVPMHDVGKVAVTDAILLKPGALTPEERSAMEEHTTAGYQVLEGSSSELIQLAAEIAYSHHERWDGKGYPRRLSGEDIPLSGRITAVADVFDALTTDRPYRSAWPLAKARAFLVENSGTHFDPACVEAFLASWDHVTSLHGAESDRESQAA
jgi:putative two-component system response regulator